MLKEKLCQTKKIKKQALAFRLIVNGKGSENILMHKLEPISVK